MSSPVPLTWRLPAASEVYIAAPVLGRTLTTLGGASNHMTGIQVPGFSAALAYQGDPPASASDDYGYLTGPPVHHETSRLPYYIPAGVTALIVSVTVLCYATGDHPPEVTVSLKDATGTDIDVGWQASGISAPPGSEWSSQGKWKLRPQLIQVNAVTPADPAVLRVSPTYILTDGKDDGMAVVCVDCVWAQVVSIHVEPVPPLTL